MSEQRHRQQQRRQRRKAAGRSRSNEAGRGRRARDAREADLELAELFADLAEIASRDADEPADALEAEQWAAMLIGTLRARPMPGEDVEAMFLPGFVEALEDLGTARALATLRALAAGRRGGARPACG